MPVLIQYAIEDGPITLHEVWRQPIGETLDLIETFCDYAVVGFNLTFDWFQLVKCYTVFRLCPRKWIPLSMSMRLPCSNRKAKTAHASSPRRPWT